MMHITHITVDNVRCYQSAEIDFGKGGKSLVICGNNGSGKSSILRSIALGLCDHISAGALLRDLPGDFIRKIPNDSRKSREAVITIDLASSGRSTYTIATTFRTRKDVGFEWVETHTKKNGIPLDEEYKFPWQDIFVTAYGAGLRTLGSEDYVQYLAPDAVYSLFDYSYHLHNPELAWRRLINVSKNKKATSRLIANSLKEILSLDDGSSTISLEENGIFVHSSWGKQELDALGDGYRALVTLTLDILAWQLLARNHKLILRAHEFGSAPSRATQHWKGIDDFKSLRGIVLIDEIEKHLHPRLQLRVLSSLRRQFPGIQFIVSTHSPLVISSAGDVPSVFIEAGHIGERKHLQGWLAENVYYEMGTGGSRPEEFKLLIAEYEKLLAQQVKRPLTKRQRAQLDALKTKLMRLPGTDMTRLVAEATVLLRSQEEK